MEKRKEMREVLQVSRPKEEGMSWCKVSKDAHRVVGKRGGELGTLLCTGMRKGFGIWACGDTQINMQQNVQHCCLTIASRKTGTRQATLTP